MNEGIILGIESSCDETAVALVRGGREVLASVIHSQVDLHSHYGGIIPELAGRSHVERITVLVEEAFSRAKLSEHDIDGIAVTVRPGLVGSLIVGISAAKALAFAWDKPLIGLDHIEGHIHSVFLNRGEGELSFPLLTLVASGGHTSIYHSESHLEHRRISKTIDDAAGEAFDKVGKMLGLPFPGGPAIDRHAKKGNPKAIRFPRGKIKNNDWDFSFSGLKTSVLYRLKGVGANKKDAIQLSEAEMADVCASFQEAVVDALVSKLLFAAREFGVRSLALAGGVACNSRLRAKTAEAAGKAKCELWIAPVEFCMDNAAMIAGLGYYHLREGKISALDELDACAYSELRAE